jgi:O-antigen ligase
MFEYVRPQSIYPILSGIPLSFVSLLMAVGALLFEGRAVRLPSSIFASLASFIVVILASSLFAVQPSESIKDLQIFSNWVLLVVLIAGTVTTERRWFLFLILYLLVCLKMSQHGFLSWAKRGFAFASWGVTGSPGWFTNSGEFALQMGMFVPAATYFIISVRRYVTTIKQLILLFLPISGIASIVASSSRGGLLALIVVLILTALRSKFRIRSLAFLSVGLPILWLVVPGESKARFGTAGSDSTSQLRLRYWQNGLDMAFRHPVLGVGQGNWTSYYRENYWVAGDSLNRFTDRGEAIIQPSHNSFVEVVAQLGFAGLAAFTAVILGSLTTNRRTRTLLEPLGQRGAFLTRSTRAIDAGTVVFCVAGFFMSVAFYPFLWMQVAMTIAVHNASRRLLRELGGVGNVAKTITVSETRPSDRRTFAHFTAASAAVSTKERGS